MLGADALIVEVRAQPRRLDEDVKQARHTLFLMERAPKSMRAYGWM